MYKIIKMSILIILLSIIFTLFFLKKQSDYLDNYKPIIVESVNVILDSTSTVPGSRTSKNIRRLLSKNLQSDQHSIVLPQKNINNDLSDKLYNITKKFWITLDENSTISIPPSYSLPSYTLELFPLQNENFSLEKNTHSNITEVVTLPSEFLLNNNTFNSAKKTVATIDLPIYSSAIKIGSDIFDIDNGFSHVVFKTSDLYNSSEILNNKYNAFTNSNASFEKGLWNENVENCSNTLPGEPELSMRLSNDSTDDGYSLEIGSKNHKACTSKSFPIVFDPAKTYRLSFDYKNIKGGIAQYYYEIRNPDGEKTSGGQVLTTDNNDWNSYSTLLNTELNNAKFIKIYFYAPSDGRDEVINIYDNLEIVEIKSRYTDNLLLTYENINEENNHAQILEIENSFGRQKFKIDNLIKPIILIRNDPFNDQLVLKIKNKIRHRFSFDEKMPAIANFVVDEYSNGWYIDTTEYCQNSNLCTQNPDGSYNMELVLEFFPQRWFYLGLLISGTTLVGIIGYLGYDFVRRRKIKVVVANKQK